MCLFIQLTNIYVAPEMVHVLQTENILKMPVILQTLNVSCLFFFFLYKSHSNRCELLAHSILTTVLSAVPEQSNPHFRDFACANPCPWNALLEYVPVVSCSYFFRPLSICHPTSIISHYPPVPKFCYFFIALITT